MRDVRPSTSSLNSTRTQYGLNSKLRLLPEGSTRVTVSRLGVQLDQLMGTARAVIELERDVDEQDVEAEKAEHRPGADEQERHAGDEAHQS